VNKSPAEIAEDAYRAAVDSVRYGIVHRAVLAHNKVAWPRKVMRTAMEAAVDSTGVIELTAELNAARHALKNVTGEGFNARAPSSEQLARLFHSAYGRLAPKYGLAIHPGAREFDPESLDGKLMIAMCSEILAAIASEKIRD
jgi:hypothetical protein